MLKVQKLNPNAILPTVGHAGSDLGFDVYASEDVFLTPGIVKAVPTGIAAHFDPYRPRRFGFVIKDRSSMAAKGVTTSAGVIDGDYRGEIKVLMTAVFDAYHIKAGDKIAQILPQEVFTGAGIVEVDDLGDTTRGAKGFGSTGS